MKKYHLFTSSPDPKVPCVLCGVPYCDVPTPRSYTDNKEWYMAYLERLNEDGRELEPCNPNAAVVLEIMES